MKHDLSDEATVLFSAYVPPEDAFVFDEALEPEPLVYTPPRSRPPLDPTWALGTAAAFAALSFSAIGVSFTTFSLVGLMLLSG